MIKLSALTIKDRVRSGDAVGSSHMYTLDLTHIPEFEAALRPMFVCILLSYLKL